MDISKKILSDIVVFNKYARHLPEENRRETWEEIVTRNKNMHLKKFPELAEEIEDAYRYVYEKKVLPSMRALQFGGKAMEVNPARGYNCSYTPMDAPEAFSELMFLLLSGCGVGYSVQRRHVRKLPSIQKSKRTRRFLIADSIEGWADSVKVLMDSYFSGKSTPIFDFSDIRPRGTPLKTSGGKAPGPNAIMKCLERLRSFLDRMEIGHQLTPLEVHDICCWISDAVIAGDVRRSAMIALFDVDDEEMLTCKSNYSLPPVGDILHDLASDSYVFQVEYRDERVPVTMSEYSYNEYIRNNHKLPWYMVAPQRARSNNSAVVVRHKITKSVFDEMWKTVELSNAGEPGFFFTNNAEWGLNPCAEISLRPNQFCNLGSINTTDLIDQEDFDARAKAVSFICTLQASYTDFHYLRDIWRETTEKEALIGVSLAGIATGKVLELDRERAANVVKKENARVAKLIGIKPSARCTTVKPDGNSSLVIGSSSGVHAWHDEYYVRRMRVGKNESLYTHLLFNHPELVEDDHFQPNSQAVISVPQKAPDGAITRHESALDLLNRVAEIWKTWVKPGHRKGDNYNNVSATISVKSHEWKEVGEWMWANRDNFTALSVLPFDGGTYIQAPFETITKKEYNRLMSQLVDIDLTQVSELEDGTSLADQAACAGAVGCEVV